MITKTHSAVLQGLALTIIEVEVQQTPGLPALVIIGLASKAVGEAKERLTTALSHGKFRIKQQRTIINLAPTDLKKTSPGLDLAMIVGVLAANSLIPPLNEKVLLLGEVGLTGDLKAVRGALPIVSQAHQFGFTQVILPQANLREVSFIDSMAIYPAANLNQVVAHLTKKTLLPALIPTDFPQPPAFSHTQVADITGHPIAKRVLEIAVAGGHHLLMLGPPGSGKTVLAQAAAGLQTPLTKAELIEGMSIYAVTNHAYSFTRPFRAPHHTISHTGLLGGGPELLPGEISLAHGGVLFLDELTEFSRRSLEALRQPLESGQVNITRAHGSVSYPAQFTLIAAANPCPCGYYGSQVKHCTCPPGIRENYFKKISGPWLDRIDLTIWVEPTTSLLSSRESKNQAAEIKQRLIWARHRQQQRYAQQKWHHLNSHLSLAAINQQQLLTSPARKLVKTAERKLHLSARSVLKIIRVAQTIADLELEDTAQIKEHHVLEALQYRFQLQ